MIVSTGTGLRRRFARPAALRGDVPLPEDARVRAILSRMKRVLGWLWMGGVIAAIIAVQAVQRSEPLASMNKLLNGARVLIPAGIAITIVGTGLVLGAWIHGMVFDSVRTQPGKISGSYAGPSPRGGWRFGFFKGWLLWGAEFHEESGISEVKRSWRTGEWLTVHRYLRATIGLVGLPLVLIGVFGTIALVADVTGVRLLLLLALAYAIVRLGFALIRA
jgi:hypothetical protein